MSGLTKEERYLLELYIALSADDSLEQSINRYQVGSLAGLTEKAVDTICKFLIRANFIRKASEDEIYLTKQGRELASSLYEDNHQG